jgi:hypothetical protein
MPRALGLTIPPYAHQKAMERWEAEFGPGWRPTRVGSNAETEAEVELYRRWTAARDRLTQKPDGLAGRRNGVELIKARRRITNP